MFPHPDSRLLRRIDNAQFPARVGKVRVQTAAGIAVAGRRTQSLKGHPQAGADNLARIDRVADCDAVVRPANVARGGETLLQHGSGIDGVIKRPIQGRMRDPVFGSIGCAG